MGDKPKEAIEMLTMKEVADKLRVSVRTVQRLIDQGVIVGRRVGRQWRFPANAVQTYMAGSDSRQTKK
jgi:excisionase family DNA binding protein